MRKLDKKSWLTGFALGLCGKALPVAGSGKEPVAYLYNGVRLPKLPDADGYQKMVITCNPEKQNYKAFAAQKESYIKTVTTASGNIRTDVCFDPPSKSLYGADADAGAWYHQDYSSGTKETVYNEWKDVEEDNYITLQLNSDVRNSVLWSNHDILNVDGTVYFAKCAEPVPVYE